MPAHVLITESSGKSLFAIERVQPGVYAQCKLASWVKLSHLTTLPPSDTINAAQMKRPLSGDTADWWLGLTNQPKSEASPSFQQRIKHLNRQAGLDLRKPEYVSAQRIPPLENVPQAEPTISSPTPTMGRIGISLQGSQSLKSEQTPQDSNDLLKSVKVQYMESLYRSKASLAYFAKGPLSRARADCSENIDGPARRKCLVEYLRGLIIPLSLLDKKYREALPNLITDLPHSNMSEDERNEVMTKCRKNSRKSKKEKIGKNGLYPQEEVDVLNWWLDHVASAPACESSEVMAEATKLVLLEQKTRETFLQIILALEVLALETVLPIEFVEYDRGKDFGKAEPSRKKQNSKKAQDLSLLLDLSIDRLCIWQSMAVENVDSSKTMNESGRATSDHGLSSKKQDSNHLRDFCVDVVLPL